MNPRRSDYRYYGGRGIEFRFRSFEQFYTELGEKPEPKRLYSLDRINNQGHYEPGNVRWATREEQQANRRPIDTGVAMPRRCTICRHTDRQAIDSELFRNGTALRDIAGQFGVSRTALHRHKQHVPIEVQKALKGEKLTAELPVRKQRYVEGVLAGKSKRAAALAAGYSESMSSHAAEKIETPDVKATFARLVREAVPPEKIAETLKAGMNAMETKFFSEKGVVTDQRDVIDWSERRQYASLAAELGGYHTPGSKEGGGGGGVILILPRSESEPSNRTVIEAEQQGPIVMAPRPAED